MAQENTLNQDPKDSAASKQLDTSKMLAALAYLGLLVLVPLLVNQDKKDRFIHYHTKQGVVLAGVGILLLVFRWILPGGSFIYYGIGFSYLLWAAVGLVVTLVQLAVVVLAIMGIVAALGGEKKPLPLIGDFAERLKI